MVSACWIACSASFAACRFLPNQRHPKARKRTGAYEGVVGLLQRELRSEGDRSGGGLLAAVTERSRDEVEARNDGLAALLSWSARVLGEVELLKTEQNLGLPV